jgi:hypothetical protein
MTAPEMIVAALAQRARRRGEMSETSAAVEPLPRRIFAALTHKVRTRRRNPAIF